MIPRRVGGFFIFMKVLPNTLIDGEKKPLADQCGIVAAYGTKDFSFFNTGLCGLKILQTRGYDGSGFGAITSDNNIWFHKGIGMVSEVFTQEVIEKYTHMRARSWTYQVRYGTSGAAHTDNVQPLRRTHKATNDVFLVAHNGQFSKEAGVSDNHISDTLIFSDQLAQASEHNWDQRLQTLLKTKHGAWSLVVATKDALYLARDRFGFRPLSYGHAFDAQTQQMHWVVASETGALEAMGVSDMFELMPGTLAKISDKGLEIIVREKGPIRALCIFENIYIQHGAGKAHLPRTNQRQINSAPTVDEIRRRSGRILAREAPLTRVQVDMVIGVPGTGIEGGMSFARDLDLPYFQAITDKADKFSEQRTFMTAQIQSIYQKVLDHFNFDPQALVNRNVALVDDSIVRGNITKGLVYLLKNFYHVKDIHLRVLCPPIDKPCHLGVNTREGSELIAAAFYGDVNKISEALGAQSLAYLSIAGLKEAMTGNPNASGFCTGCMFGQRYPIDKYGQQIAQKRKKEIVQKKISAGFEKLPAFKMV